MNQITYDDFAKLQIKIATVTACEKVDGSDKLLKLTLNCGDEDSERVVLSGIAKQYSPDSLINKQVPVLVNLAPRKMMGLESNGMILCADENDEAIMLHPEKFVKEGSEVR